MRRTVAPAARDARPAVARGGPRRSRDILAALTIAWAVPMAVMCVTAFGVPAPAWPPPAGSSLPAWRLTLLLVLAISGPVALFLPLPLFGIGRDYLRKATLAGSRRLGLWTGAVGAAIALEVGFGVAVAQHMASHSGQDYDSLGATVLPAAFILIGALLIALLAGTAAPRELPQLIERIPRWRMRARLDDLAAGRLSCRTTQLRTSRLADSSS